MLNVIAVCPIAVDVRSQGSIDVFLLTYSFRVQAVILFGSGTLVLIL